MRRALAVLSVLAVAVVVLLGVAACGQNQQAAKPTVVSTIFANYDIVRAVGGEYVHNVILLPPRTSPHDYSPTLNDKRAVQEASLVIKNGLHLDDWVDNMLSTNKTVHVLEIAKAIRVNPLDTHELIDDPRQTQNGAPMMGPTTAEAQGHANEHGPGNPHIWLDPQNQMAATRVVATALAAIDPAHAPQYRANAEKYVTQLAALDQEFKDAVAHFTQKDFIGSHAAYEYLGRRYGLNQVASLEEVEDAGMTVGQARKVIDLIKKDHLKAVFVENAMPSKDADMIVRETGVKKLVLQPLATYDSKDDTYVGLMEQNLKSMKEAME